MGSPVQIVGGKRSLGNRDGPAKSASDKPTGTDKASLRLQYVTDCWTDLKNAYIVYHQSCWQAQLFYANQSWIDWDDARKVWYPLTPSDDWVPRPRINRFSPTVDAIASNVYQIPEVEAVAKPLDDPDSNMIAEIGNKLAEHFVDAQGLRRQKDTQEDKSGHAAQIWVLNGSMFTILRVRRKSIGQLPKMSPQQTFGYECEVCNKWTQVPVGQDPPNFCPTCGNPVEPEPVETMAAEQGPDGNPLTDEQSEYNVELYIGNPLWAFPRAGAKSMEDSPFFMWCERDTLDSIYFRFNKFEAEPDAEWPDGYSVTYEHALNFWYTGYSSSTMQVKDSCLVKEMYVEPNKLKDHPEGFYFAEINGKEAANDEWQFPCHPITMFKYLNLPTIFFARSVGFDLVELQRELNAYESVIKLHSMTSAVDPVVVDANTIVSEITGRSDKVIKWRSTGSPTSEPPHRMGAGHLDDGIYKQRDNLHAEFQNVSMAVNAFRGQQEGAITASSAISQLRGQAELMFSKPVGNWNNGWCETIRKAVKFMQFYYTLEQLAAIVGPGKEQEIQKFKAADLDVTTEWIPSSHGLPKTRDERRQEMMTLWDKGALDIQQPSVRKEIYELFGNTGMMQAFNKDATNARLENTAIKNGAGWMGPPQVAVGDPGEPAQQVPVPIPPKPGMDPIPPIQPMIGIEDLAVHFYFHCDQIKSTDFKKWPPPAQQALIVHALETDKAQKLMIMQQMTMASAGAGKGPAGGSGGKPKGPAGLLGNGKSQAESNGAEGAAAQEQGGEQS